MKLAVLGGSGRTGRLLVELALQQGHEVRALVRTPSAFPVTHPNLVVEAGDATNAADIQRVVAGTDAVVSALGPVAGGHDVCSRATANVLAAKVTRYLAVSGAGLDAPGDRKDLPGRVISKLVKLVSPAQFADKVRELELLLASDCAFTLVRPPRLVDGPRTGRFRVALDNAPGTRLRRADLAAFLLSTATGATHVRQAPFIAQ